MTARPHDHADERFADWLDGRMAPRDRERFEAELRVNPGLRARAEEYRRTVETVQRALRAPLPKVDVADAVLARIAVRETATPGAPSVSPWRGASRRAIWYSSGVAAAVFALLALLIEWDPPPDALDLADAPAAPAPTTATGPADAPQSVPQWGGEGERKTKNEEPGADGAVRLVQPSADPVAETERLADDTRLAGGRQPSGEVPLETASTMLPQVELKRQAAVYRDADRERAQPTQSDMFFLGSDASARDLRRALPPGELVVQQLRAAPQAAYARSKDVGEREAWLVEGSGPEVYSFLARLSEVGRSCGFDVANSEVATADVNELLVPSPVPLDQVAGALVLEKDKAPGAAREREAERPPLGGTKGEEAKAGAAVPESKRVEGAKARGGRQGETRSGQERTVDDRAAAPGRDDVAAPAGAPEEQAPQPSVPQPPAPQPPESPPARVRVVIVIDRSTRAPVNR
jgi:hypothetical protein